jgi:alpha-beta hydrolase superfamily lysophospholipase
MSGKRIVLLAIGLVLLFHAAWYALSLAITHRNPPDEKIVAAFNSSHKSLLKLDRAKGIREKIFLNANSHYLHLDILTLVFIPGTSVCAEVYMEFLYAMYEQGFNVVAFDARGHGRISGLRGDYTVDDVVDDALSKPVEKITVPVMLIQSDLDHIVPREYVENIFNRLTCPKEYFLLKGKNHPVMTNNVDQVSPAAAAWLRSL